MILVKPSIKHLDITDVLESIEQAGRTCYKSEDKITEGSAEKFVQMLLKREHHAMIEHGNFILSVGGNLYEEILKIEDRQYIRMSKVSKGHGCIISGNPRAFMDFCFRPDIPSGIQRILAVELSKDTPILFKDVVRQTDHLMDSADDRISATLVSDTNNLSRSEKLKHQVASYRIVCNRGYTHEQVRHRPPSYAQESTRFCNYKGGVTFIIPPWFGKDWSYATRTESACPENEWAEAMRLSECFYENLIKWGWKPQKARGVLPIDLKTEIVVTCNLQQWMIFFGLRCTPARAPKEELVNGIWYHASAPHPQMQEIANMILVDMKERVPVIFDSFLEEK